MICLAHQINPHSAQKPNHSLICWQKLKPKSHSLIPSQDWFRNQWKNLWNQCPSHPASQEGPHLRNPFSWEIQPWYWLEKLHLQLAKTPKSICSTPPLNQQSLPNMFTDIGPPCYSLWWPIDWNSLVQQSRRILPQTRRWRLLHQTEAPQHHLNSAWIKLQSHYINPPCKEYTMPCKPCTKQIPPICISLWPKMIRPIPPIMILWPQDQPQRHLQTHCV